MSNDKHYPTHPGAEHPPIMTCEIPLEEYESLKRENAELKSKLESVQVTAYAESVDAGMRERRLRRAIYKACFNWAHFAVAFFAEYKTKEKWRKMESKCRAKAEEYK